VFTQYQSLYFAHALTLAGHSEQQISRTAASARIEMNPHQIEAACFALKSPLRKGVLLADEVGLGKTIEAGLVIAQKWAEKRRAILLVVPASLRKQWNQELADKFDLSSLIIDSGVAKHLRKSGVKNPFESSQQIIICSYEYLARQKKLVMAVAWDLVVFDEAHKLRNLYRKDGNKTAKAIQQATLHAQAKVLLSATPIQNNLMELYGLTQMMDEYYFGDERSFRALYASRKKNSDALADLKKRIKPLCHRTLRRQVQEEGGINFTNRYSITQDFSPSEAEWELFNQLSDYLQRPHLHAVNYRAKHLVTIGIRKILASSSYAVSGTLQGMIKRLESQQLLDEGVLSDLEEADDWRDQFETDEPISHQQEALADELNDLKSYLKLAQGISTNAKSEALLLALGRAFDMTERLGGARKAVIFTESCRTQQFLKEQLESNGFAGRVVLLNGSNSDSGSKKIHRDWLQKHKGSARISGSKTSDMKAALVDQFRENADILISTEAGGEGINLQFCSLLINYDLPWNPQKVEQRIGRVHRYGQKHDVVVVNFVNRENPADARVFQLLNDKFKLFEGVFGASDEILGALEGNIDIEKRIYEIYQKCRDEQQIQDEFNRLQQDLDELLVVKEEQARVALLDNFDRDVVVQLKSRRDSSRDFLDAYEQMLLDLARAELAEIKVHRNHFFYQNQRYDLRWELVEKNESEFFRLQTEEHQLAWQLAHKAKARQATLTAAELSFHYDHLEGAFSALQPYLGQAGLLQLQKLSFCYAGVQEEHLLVVAQTDGGMDLSADEAENLLKIPATARSLATVDGASLLPLLEQRGAELSVEVNAKIEHYFDEESDKLERWSDDRRQALQLTLDALDREMRALKRTIRPLSSLSEKLEVKQQIKKWARERDRAMTEYHESKKEIEKKEEQLLDDIKEKLALKMKSETLFCVRWTLNP